MIALSFCLLRQSSADWRYCTLSRKFLDFREFQTMSQAVKDAKDTVEDLKGAAKDVAADVKDTAKHAAQSAQNAAHKMADAAKMQWTPASRPPRKW
jgi:methyl-accepting chemotaxis protein